MANRLTQAALQEAPSARLWGTGITLLDYRPVGEGTYEATRWITVLYVPLVPGGTWVVRPRRMSSHVGPLIGNVYEFERLATKPTPVARVIRMYALGTSLGLLAFGPLVWALWAYNRMTPDQSLVAMVAALAVPFGILTYLNRKTEQLYESAQQGK
jgi:hypothetical protein